ncbi:MAG: DUF4396 domain-containing protein [Bacteroidota bacterium]
MQHRLQTNLHCQACVNKVKPYLDNSPKVQDWSADISSQVILNVEGEISVNELHSILQREGYAVVSSSGFWKGRFLWRRASFNTLNCLLGCSIGDFGMVFYLQAYYPTTPLHVQMLLAIVAGLCTSIILETCILKSREGFPWIQALKTAFGMSFISMVTMELAMTSTDFMITGGKAAFADPVYWLALLPALIVGFLVPLPYNYYRLKKFNRACH